VGTAARSQARERHSALSRCTAGPPDRVCVAAQSVALSLRRRLQKAPVWCLQQQRALSGGRLFALQETL
jgi:hypothetical protein